MSRHGDEWEKHVQSGKRDCCQGGQITSRTPSWWQYRYIRLYHSCQEYTSLLLSTPWCRLMEIHIKHLMWISWFYMMTGKVYPFYRNEWAEKININKVRSSQKIRSHRIRAGIINHYPYHDFVSLNDESIHLWYIKSGTFLAYRSIPSCTQLSVTRYAG